MVVALPQALHFSVALHSQSGPALTLSYETMPRACPQIGHGCALSIRSESIGGKLLRGNILKVRPCAHVTLFLCIRWNTPKQTTLGASRKGQEKILELALANSIGKLGREQRHPRL